MQRWRQQTSKRGRPPGNTGAYWLFFLSSERAPTRAALMRGTLGCRSFMQR